MAQNPHNPLRKAANKLTKPEKAAVLDTYKVLVEMADRVSQRRQAANNFYLSANTAIIGASAYLSSAGPSGMNMFVIAAAGIGVCVLWQRNIESYKTLNDAKFKVINQIEEALPVAAFTTEWAYLDPHGQGTRHRPFHVVEIIVPRIFICLHAVQAMRAIPWESLLLVGRSIVSCIAAVVSH
jgi:hypothetical protein